MIKLKSDFEYVNDDESLKFLEIKNEILSFLATENPIPLSYISDYNCLYEYTPLYTGAIS
jgi:hypothetical protein